METSILQVPTTALAPEWLEENIRRFSTTAPPRPQPKINVRWVFVTPELAQHMLQWHNADGNQRKLRPHRVGRLAYQMRHDFWDEGSPQFIVFDEYRQNADGQHRLHAVIESGCGQWFMIAWSIPKSARKNIDTHARRSAADNLMLAGAGAVFHGMTPSVAQAIARAFIQGGSMSKAQLEAEELEHVLMTYNEAFRFTFQAWSEIPRKLVGLRRAAVAAVVARAYLHLDTSEHVRLGRFIEVLSSGAAQLNSAEQTITKYRDFLMTQSHRISSNGNGDIYLRGCASLQAFLKGEQRQLNRPLGQDPFPIPEDRRQA